MEAEVDSERFTNYREIKANDSVLSGKSAKNPYSERNLPLIPEETGG